MLADVFDMLFGCWHRRCSFPITTKKGGNNHSQAASVTGTYVVCLHCGKEFPYDWNQMKMLSPAPKHTKSPQLTAETVRGVIKAA
jgi:hypothetical protein